LIDHRTGCLFFELEQPPPLRVGKPPHLARKVDLPTSKCRHIFFRPYQFRIDGSM